MQLLAHRNFAAEFIGEVFEEDRLVLGHRDGGWILYSVSAGFGLFLVYQIGFVDGLFTSQVHCIPRSLLRFTAVIEVQRVFHSDLAS